MSRDEPSDRRSREVEQLRNALATRPVIEQAKGMLMLLRGWTADEAFDALSGVSQHTNVKLHEVATILVATGSGERPPLPDNGTVQAVLTQLHRSTSRQEDDPGTTAAGLPTEEPAHRG
jgi:hypothetical protein